LDLGAIPSLLAAKCIFWRKIPIIIGEDILTSKHVYTETFPEIRLWLIAKLYPYATRILVQTKVQKNDLDAILKTKDPTLVRVSPNWLPLDYQPVSTVPEKDIDILFVGRFDPQKNLYLFLDIISKLQKNIPHLNVVMIGDGPDRPGLVRYVKKHKLPVRFIASTLDVRSYYLRSKTFLLTSNYEGFPLTILEAISCFSIPILRDLPEIITFFGQDCPLVFHQSQQAVSLLAKYLTSKTAPIATLSSFQNRIYKSQKIYISDFVAPVLDPSR
jgi:glycosyltransferase involved in cell wall biosynthesis